MSDEAVKRRLRRAIQAAALLLERSGYTVSISRHPIYDLTADRYKKDIRKIKVCLDKMSASEIRKIEQSNGDAIYSREIWVYRASRGKSAFDIKII